MGTWAGGPVDAPRRDVSRAIAGQCPHAAAGDGASANALGKTASIAKAPGAQTAVTGDTHGGAESFATGHGRWIGRTECGLRSQRHAQHGERDDDLGRGPQRAPGDAAGRSAGGSSWADRDPALRRRQSQPVFSARLQSRPRHRSRDLCRRRAGQHAHPCAWPRLLRSKLADAGNNQRARNPQRALLRRRRGLLFRWQSAYRADRQRAESHRADHRGKFWLSPNLRHGLRQGR